MIDINLARKIKEKKPKPSKRTPPNPKLIIVLSSICILFIIFYVFGDAIVGLFIPKPSFQPISQITQQQVQPPVDTPQVEQPVVEEQPPEEENLPIEETETTEPVTAVSWNYSQSSLHFTAYIAFTEALPENLDYKVITVSGDRIIAELETTANTQLSRIQSSITNQLPMYSFSFTPNGTNLQVWGSLKSRQDYTGTAPDIKYADAEANVDALNAIAKTHNITLEAQNLTGPIIRDNLTVFPGWIKFYGSESSMLAFLTQLKNEKLSLNIVRIVSSYSGKRQLKNQKIQLFFQFELII